ncbi:hypothetical protein FVF58_40300 [Paraburkholderia panacisoli]|jgi:hypothetical protein|uniref:Uncharacterized protein n=1 Tax=Paraburkholderia panacisoli TaxID=2603818 RepID=A0A5B0GAW4_9BURK|nr:hypothetical protein [Paraburkholderia panacisoli]KAA1000577.1 hypothetical protein FVF58_40300 [Paraburkholderia panacisoli]
MRSEVRSRQTLDALGRRVSGVMVMVGFFRFSRGFRLVEYQCWPVSSLIDHAKRVAPVCRSSRHATRRHRKADIELDFVRIGINADQFMLFDLREK